MVPSPVLCEGERTTVATGRPQDDEIEVSLLGPGYGESVVIHLGGQQWMIVDSCVDSDDLPAPLAYLHRLGVPLTSVVLLVATHWHDDHVKGFSECVRQCVNARIFMSG